MSYSIADVNDLSADQFVKIFGNVIELCTSAAEDLESKRPFKDVDDLCTSFSDYLDHMDIDGKLTVLKLHPDLAGRLAASGDLTRESSEEQRSAGLDKLTVEQKHCIDDYNERYKIKFGFPFIICARENKVLSILSGLKSRCDNTKSQEISTAINEVKKICRLRILDIIIP